MYKLLYRQICLIAIVLFLDLVFAFVAQAAPTGGQVVAGSGSISQSGSATTIQQNTYKMAINWQSFNIAKNESVTFHQPSASAIALNRILGNSASKIFGKLSANGQVFLLNPNGVIFGKHAQVNVGGIVASTLNITNQQFLNNNFTFSGNSTASVINKGNLKTSDGGYVALIGASVVNTGSIKADLGTAVLVAGQKVTLHLDNGSLLGFTVDKGAVEALVKNGGIVQSNGGQIYLTAKAANKITSSVVNNTGVVIAQTIEKKNGHIYLWGGKENGTVKVSGTLDASAPTRHSRAGGNPISANGGFIETSATHVQIVDSARITTAAPNGKAGTWLIDPTDFTINAGSDLLSSSGIGADTLESSLADGNILIKTVNDGIEDGNIYVDAPLSWSSHKLTLKAINDIYINQSLTVTGTGGLILKYGQASADGGTSTYNIYAPINLASTANFQTQKGSNVANLISYTVITTLGSAGSTTGTDLQGIQGNLTGNYVLGNDIDASFTSSWNSGKGFEPIGNTSNDFTGTFDGLGHVINGLVIGDNFTNTTGLFGAIGAGGIVRNVGMVGGSVASDSGSIMTGALSGSNKGTIENSYATTLVSGSSINNGGLVGYNAANGIIKSSYATGNVTTNNGTASGGLVGYNNGTIKNAYATGNVSGSEGSRIGGLVGYNDYNGKITNVYASGVVSGTNVTSHGGLVGSNYHGTITNGYWDVETTGQATSAGSHSAHGLTTLQMMDASNFQSWDFANIWGNMDNQTTPYLIGLTGNQIFYINSLPTGLISPTNLPDLYAIVQNIYQLQAIKNDLSSNYILGSDINASSTSSWHFEPIGNMGSGNQFTGIFDGLGHVITGLVIDDSSTNTYGLFGAIGSSGVVRNVGLVGGHVKNHHGGTMVGALAGYNDGTIENSYSTALVGGSMIKNGGLVGYNTGHGVIRFSYATGDVDGHNSGGSSGGLVGFNSGTIENSYATGNVIGGNGGRIGGLVGYNDYNGKITNVYASGVVSGTNVTSHGGLVGSNYHGTITNGYWDVETTGQATSAGSHSAHGLTTLQMMDASNFQYWDIATSGGENKIWRIYEGHTLPLLQTFLKPITASLSTVTTTYDGTDQSSKAASGVSWSAAPDMNHIEGSVFQGTATNAGDYNFNGNGFYSDQQGYDITINGTGILAIKRAKLTITPTSGQSKVYGTSDSLSGFTYSEQGLLQGDSITGHLGRATGENVGDYKYTTGNLSAGDNYNVVLSSSSPKFSIIAASLTITPISGQSKVYGDSDPSNGFAYTNSGLVQNVTPKYWDSTGGYVNASEIDDTITGNLGRAAGKDVGSYVYKIGTVNAGGNYSVALSTTTPASMFAITKAYLTITANNDIKFFDGMPYFGSNGVTYNGLVNGENSSVLVGTLIYTGTSQGAVQPGNHYTIIPQGLTSSNYDIHFVNGTLEIENASPQPSSPLFVAYQLALSIVNNPNPQNSGKSAPHSRNTPVRIDTSGALRIPALLTSLGNNK